VTLEEKVHLQRLRLFRRAEELANVSAACREAGVARSLYYQLRDRYRKYGPDGLHPKHRRGRPGRPPALDVQIERRILAEALAQPAWGPQKHSDQLALRGIYVATSTVYRALKRHRLGTRTQRFGILERHSAAKAGLLTERTKRTLEKARPTPSRAHIEADEPGELVGFDCFYIGKLKGVGKVWQITACDTASSFTWAKIFLGDPRAEVSAEFLCEVYADLDHAGWPLQRVLTDGGSEFKSSFTKTCRGLGVRQTKTKPRHPFTNGFVERVQGTLLHEHWRIEFRRRYFTHVGQIERSLQSALRFYNYERAHRGYRTRGRTPASILWGANDEKR
jgi:transposase InsO family protein